MLNPDSIIYKIYCRLPVLVQNLLFSIAGLKNRANRFSKHYYIFFDFLKKSEWWNKKQIEDYQNQELQKIVKHAYETVPFYKDLFDSNQIDYKSIKSAEDLKALPIIDKKTIRKSKFSVVSKIIPKNKLIKNLTSGTSGQALTVYHTQESLSKQWAIWTRHKARFGINFGDKYLTFGARVPIPPHQDKPPFWRRNYSMNQVYLSTYHLTPAYMDSIIDWLNKEQFDFFTGYPSAMYILANYMHSKAITLAKPPKYIVCGSDALIPHFQTIIEKSFKAKVTEQYGMAEACGNFSKCEQGKFHLDFEFGIVELLPIEGSDNPKMRRMVFTGFTNYAMPLIRYDIGDYGYISEKTCSCGRQSLILDSIDGRCEDYIRTPDGRKAIGMNQVFEWAEGADEIQIVQNNIESIDVNIVPNKSYSEKDIHNLETELRKRIGAEIKINYRLVASIPRSKTGKFRAIISNISIKDSGESELQSYINAK